MKKIILLIPLLLSVFFVGAQNNPIFFGSDGDGWTMASFEQQSNTTINHGGDDDGWFVGSYLQTAANNTIYKGGDEDGWQFTSYLQASNQTIYHGDTNEGWYVGSYMQLNANDQIYRGDTNDGWHLASYLQAGNDYVYNGGTGDGWASVILPLGPLPIELLAFTGFVKNAEHILNWSITNESNVAYFDVERSANAKQFSHLGKVDGRKSNQQIVSYDFTNHEPLIGHNYYRLKMVDEAQNIKYSNVILLLRASDKSNIAVYPNPTASAITVSLQSDNRSAAFTTLYDLNGKVLYQKNTDSSTNTFSIDMQNVAAGTYQLIIKKGTESHTIKIQKQ